MATKGIPDKNGKTIIYTFYTVKAGEKTLHQIARDQLYDEGRFKEIMEWKDPLHLEVTKELVPNQILLIPPVSADIGSFTITADADVRSGSYLEASLIYKAVMKDNTLFHYSKKTLTLDSNGRMWVQVRTVKVGNVIHTVGWMCVKHGQTYFTNPQIG